MAYSAGSDWGKYASDILWSSREFLPPAARVLDLGCGTGRNAIFLARLGYEVLAVDISQVAIRQLESSARSAGVAVRTECADVRDIKLPANHFDMVLAYGVLNSIDPQYWSAILGKMQVATKPGGVNVVTFFTRYSSADSVDGSQVLALAEPNFALGEYRGWSVIKHDSRCESHQHGTRPKHQHVTERLAIRKVAAIAAQREPKVVAVIGPTDISKAEMTDPIAEGSLLRAAEAVGDLLAATGKRLLCVPDKGVARAVFLAYGARNPQHPAQVLAPVDDPNLARFKRADWLTTLGFPALIESDVTWESQAKTLVERADAIVAVGMAVGSIMEILWTKWIRRPVYMSFDTSPRLPLPIRREIALFELPDVDSLVDYLSRTWGPRAN